MIERVTFKDKKFIFDFISRLSLLTPIIFVLVAFVGFFFSTPRSAGADEPIHQATAWYDSTHIFAVSSEKSVNGIPISITAGSPSGHPCFAAMANLSAKCQPDRTKWVDTLNSYPVINYPTPYYILVGAGQRIAKLINFRYVDLGGRVTSLSLNLTII